MIAFVGAWVLTLFLFYQTGLTWVLVIVFLAFAILLQGAYAHLMNIFLGGADPVATFGARNLRQLKTIIPIPFSITLINFLARMMWWSVLLAIFFSFSWIMKEIKKI